MIRIISILLLSLAFSGCHINPQKDAAQFLVGGVQEREDEYRIVAEAYVKACQNKDFDTVLRLTSPLTIENVGLDYHRTNMMDGLSPLLNKGTIEWSEWTETVFDETYNVGTTFMFKCNDRKYYLDVFEEMHEGKFDLYVLNIRDTRHPKFN